MKNKFNVKEGLGIGIFVIVFFIFRDLERHNYNLNPELYFNLFLDIFFGALIGFFFSWIFGGVKHPSSDKDDLQ